ncbi:MAG: lysophospholipase [Candidatus Limnocylindrales bacterium]
MSSETGTVVARDGVVLRTRHWAPDGEGWARLLLVHGIAEHSGRHERTGARFAGAGIDAWAFDLRGFGGSGGPRAFVRRWDDYLDDVADRLAGLRDGRPLVLMGHSMGGLIALTYAESARPAPDLLVLSSPAMSAGVPAPVRLLAPLLGRVTPMLRLSNNLRAEQLCADPAVGEAYFADPLVVPRSTARLGAELFAAIQRSHRDLGRLHVPTFVTVGSADTIVPPAGSEPLGALPNVERRVYPGMRHETFNEPQGEQVVADILAWLRRQTGRAAG